MLDLSNPSNITPSLFLSLFLKTGFLTQMNGLEHSVLHLSFQGCMQLIHVDDQLVDLHAVEKGKLGSFANVSIDMCAIIDR